MIWLGWSQAWVPVTHKQREKSYWRPQPCRVWRDHNAGVHGSIAGIAASSLSRIWSKMGGWALAVRAILVPAYFLNLFLLPSQQLCGWHNVLPQTPVSGKIFKYSKSWKLVHSIPVYTSLGLTNVLHLATFAFSLLYIHICTYRVVTHHDTHISYTNILENNLQTLSWDFSMVKMCNIYFILWDFISFMGFYFIYRILLLKLQYISP